MSDDLRNFIATARGLVGLDGLIIRGGFVCPAPIDAATWERRYAPDSKPAPVEVSPPSLPVDDRGLHALLREGGLRLEKPDR